MIGQPLFRPPQSEHQKHRENQFDQGNRTATKISSVLYAGEKVVNESDRSAFDIVNVDGNAGPDPR